MATLAFFLLPALAVWGGIVLMRGSIFVWAALFLVCTSVFPGEFFSFQAAGLTWTLDRLVLLLLMAHFGFDWWRGKLDFGAFEIADYLVGAFSIWLAARTLSQPLGSLAPEQPHTLMHMINGYGIPFAMYAILRTSRPNAKSLRPAFWIFTVFGIYLAITGIFEAAKLWGLVFPQFIRDPAIGIHFGRARGPMLQSVRLGVCLLASWSAIAIFTVWLNPQSKARWVLALATLPLFWGAVFVTYTRSIWMGLACIVAMLVVFCMHGILRRTFIVGGALTAGLVLAVAGSSLVAFKREYSAAETRESTYMRAAFAYVSFQMFKDRPIAGFGFNQFNVANLPYLADRSTDIRLESIRGYVHHNSFLSLLVDMGIVGFSLYAVVLAAFVRKAWSLFKNQRCEMWARGIGLAALCVTGSHVIQMAFHEVSFSAIENSLIFSAYGLVIAASRESHNTECSVAEVDG